MADIGIYGSDRREAIQDPLAQRRGAAKSPDSIPTPGVSGPKGADFSQVGESQRVLSKLLGQGSTLLQDYTKKKQAQWELDGKMAYMQGKTQEEINATGNQYSLAGFLTMQTKTQTNEFYQNSLEAIDTADRQLSPNDYRKKLSDQFGALSQDITDPFTRELMTSAADEMFPKLISQQVQSNNKWKEQQTYDSYRGMLVSEATKQDPTNKDPNAYAGAMHNLFNPNISGLTPERHRAAITEAAGIALSRGDGRIAKVLAGDPTTTDGVTISSLPQGDKVREQAISFVANIEGGFVPDDAGKGPTLYGVNSVANPQDYATSTAAYDKGDIVGAKKLAKTTFVDKYWKEIGADKLPADVAIIAFDGAVNQGANAMKDMLAKAGDDPQKLLQLRKERYLQTAQQPGKGQFLSGWLDRLNKLNTNTNSATPLADTVGELVDEKNMIGNLSSNGFTEAQINHIQSSYKSYQTEKSQTFDKDRIMNEEKLIETAKKDGNLPQILDQIKATKDANGYSDSWANSIAGKATTAIESGAKDRALAVNLSSSGINGTLYTQTPENQQKGLDLERARITSAISYNPNMTEEQKNALITETYGKSVIRNKVVDKKWATNIEAGLSGNILNPDGSVKKEALAAYKDYLFLAKNGSPGYANKYTGDAGALVTMAESYDAGGQGSDSALQTAATIMARGESGKNLDTTIDTPSINKAIDTNIEKLNPGFFASWSVNNAAGWSDVTDWQMQSAKQDPLFRSVIQNGAIRARIAHPEMNAEQAVAHALKEYQPRMELVQGNVLVGGPQKTIREAMGIQSTATNAVHMAVNTYLAAQGENIWGTDYNSWQVAPHDSPDASVSDHTFFGLIPMLSPSAIGASIRDKFKGVPPVNVQYNPENETYTIDLWANKERTQVLGRPRVIPASDIGGVYNKLVLEPDQSTWYDYFDDSNNTTIKQTKK